MNKEQKEVYDFLKRNMCRAFPISSLNETFQRDVQDEVTYLNKQGLVKEEPEEDFWAWDPHKRKSYGEVDFDAGGERLQYIGFKKWAKEFRPDLLKRCEY